jgi:hypothetical protein
MGDDLDELILLLLRTSGMRDAVLAYEEETCASHAEAITTVRNLARHSGLENGAWEVGKSAVVILTALTLGAVSFLVMFHFG